MSQLSIIKQMFEALSDEEKANFVAYLKGGPQKNSKPLGNLEQLILSHNHFTTRLTDRYQTIQTREPVPVLRAA